MLPIQEHHRIKMVCWGYGRRANARHDFAWCYEKKAGKVPVGLCGRSLTDEVRVKLGDEL